MEIQYTVRRGGGKGTCEPSQLTVAKTETQHPALPFNDDGDDDDDDDGDDDDDDESDV